MEHTGSTSLFAIFLLSIYSIVLIPYSLYHLCSGADETVVQPWQGKKKASAASRLMKKICTKGNLTLIGLWVLWLLLLWYTSATASALKPFDPFEILGLEAGATSSEIKKAYRSLSLQYHPDKNPDPAAHKYFTEFITKAYQALTDEVSRANYEKYGHPDGPQAINVGVALPEWFFTQDKKVAPLMLLALVGVGILLPLGIVSWMMLSSNKFAGPNRIMQETLAFYYHSKYSIKESQSLVRIPETLVCAMEFINLPTPAEQTIALDELRKLVLRHNPDLKEKPLFWKRKASVLKAHMLLLAFLEREQDSIPSNLIADLKFVLQKAPLLLEEMLKIALLPRPPNGYGWLTPTMAVIEMMQCMTQAVSINDRKPTNKPGDSPANLLQLPHFDADVLKKLKRRKINTLKDLLELSDEERLEALQSCGMEKEQLDEVSDFVSALPNVYLKASFEVEGEAEVMEQDVAKCKVHVVLTRPSHNVEGYDFAPKGKAVRACAPNFMFPRDENWYVLLVDPASNAVLGHAKVALLEAESIGFDRPEVVENWNAGADKQDADSRKEARPVSKALATASKFISRYNNQQRGGGAGATSSFGGEGEGSGEVGQLVEINFLAPKAGKHDLQVVVMSDCYLGMDRVLPLKLKVVPLTRAAAEGREARSMAKIQQWQESDDEKSQGDAEEGEEAGEEDEDEEEEEGDEDYDSDETGELESGPETESEDEEDEEEEEEAKGKGKASKGSSSKKGAAATGGAASATDGSWAKLAVQAGDIQEEEEDEEEGSGEEGQ